MPHCLTWDSIEPALPKRGQVGLLRATDICEGCLGEVMRDPHKALLPQDQWPADACGIMQYIHRRILSMRSPLGANLPVERQIRKDLPFPAWHFRNGNQDFGRIVSMYLDGFTEFDLKHWNDLVIGSCGQLQAAMQKAYTSWNVPRQETKALSRQIEVEDLGCHIDGVFGAVSTPRQFDVDLGAATLWLLSQNSPQHKDLQIIAGRFQFRRETSSIFHVVWFALGENGLCIQPDAAFPENLAGEIVHALMLMPLMIIDLRLPTSGTVVATDASEYGQGVCRAVGLTSSGKLEVQRLEDQRAQRWDNRIGLVDMLGGLSSWRAAFDDLGIQPAIFPFVGGRKTSNREVTAAWPDVFLHGSPSDVTPQWMRQAMDYAPSVTHWCDRCTRCVPLAKSHPPAHTFRCSVFPCHRTCGFFI